ncbi:MAG: hypothetical protein ACI4WT_09200 [Oligosphaeraceae bacterium]
MAMKGRWRLAWSVLALSVLLWPGLAWSQQSSARAEWMVGYKRMEEADAAQAARKGSDALRYYREALETFECVRRKYPTWNAALLNYRIGYCKEQIDKLGQTVGDQTGGLDAQALTKLTKEQYVTIGRLSDERKALQSRVEVLTESLERARGEAAKIAAIETGNAALTKQNGELKEELRLLGLKLGAAEREVARLKGQEGLSEELRRVAADLKLTAAQLASSQEALAKARLDNEALTRQQRQAQQAQERLTQERTDLEMALKVVRELSLARKRENEALLARYATLEKRAGDLEEAATRQEKALLAANERALRAEQSEQALRARQAEESERERQEHSSELKVLRESLEQLVSRENGTETAQQRQTLEALAVRLEQKDAKLSRLARRMAVAFTERERLLAQEEELAQLRQQLRGLEAERDRQRAIALTSQENFLALKGESDRMRVQLTSLEQRCLTLNEEVVKYRSMRERLGLGEEKGNGDRGAEERLIKAAQDVERLQARLDGQMSLARRQEDELKALRAGKAEFEAALTQRQEAETAAARRADEATREVATLKGREAELTRRLQTLEHTLQQAQTAEATLKGREEELAAARKEQATLQERVRQLEKHEADLAAARKEQTALQERVRQLEKREAELLATKAREHGKDVEAIATLESQMAQRSQESQRQNETVKNLQEQTERQRQELNRLTRERQALADKFNSERQTLAGQLAEQETRRQTLEAEAQRLRKALDDAQTTAKDLDAKLKDAEQRTQELKRQQAETADKLGAADGMAKALVKAEDEQRRLTAEVRRLRQQSELLQNQLSEAEVKSRTQQKHLEELRTGKDSGQTAQLVQRLQQAEARVKALEGVLSEGGTLPAEPAKPTPDSAAKEREQAATLQMNAALRRQNELLTKQNAERSERLAQLQRQLEELAGTRPTATAAKTGNATEAALASAEAARRLAEERVATLSAELAVLKARAASGDAQTQTDAPTLQSERDRRLRERDALVKGYVEQGLDAERQGRVEAAHWNYQKALSLVADNKTALQRLGQLAYGQGDDISAIRFLKQAFYGDPDDVKTLFALGYSYARQSQADWAVATMGRAVSLQPDNASMARVYGVTLMQLGWRDAAEREFRRALKLNPQERDAAFNLAVLLAAASSDRGQGLTREHLQRLREGTRSVAKGGDREAAKAVATMLNWLEYGAKQADARRAEARQWYDTALKLGAEPDPNLEKSLR